MDLFNTTDNTKDLHHRLGYLLVGIAVIFVLLLSRTWYLQIIKGRFYQEQSKNNRVRVVYIQPQRGRILDRNGELVVNNVASFNLYIVMEDVPDPKALLDRLSGMISLDRAELERRIANRKNNVPYMPVKIKEGLSLKEVALVESHRLELAGVQMEVEPQRNYLYGPLAAHLLGYVGEVSPGQLKDPDYEGAPPGMTVGQNGVEDAFDPHIRGKVGLKEIEVDALGHEIKTLRVVDPARGNDLFLTIDLRLQKMAEAALEGETGSIVALDPRNGEILALASHPSFDPNQLSRSLTPAEWERLSQDPRHPLTNRAIQGQYPPGSTYKLVVSAAALDTREVTPETSITCQGGMQFGRRFYRDWKRGGHGVVDLHRALVESCDVYFYEVGRRLGIERLADYSARFGLGQATGVELTSEKSGSIPSTEWKRRVKGEPWYPGETLSASIGQGFITVTPLQLANLMGTVAVSGERYQPLLIKALRDRESGKLYEFPPVKIGQVDLPEAIFRTIQKALVGVVTETGGTGRGAQSALAVIGGKTGTAQVVEAKPGVETKSLPKKLQDHAWFVAFAPAEDPRIAVVVLIENGGHGGETAAPPAKRIIEEFLKNDRAKTHQQL